MSFFVAHGLRLVWSIMDAIFLMFSEFFSIKNNSSTGKTFFPAKIFLSFSDVSNKQFVLCPLVF